MRYLSTRGTSPAIEFPEIMFSGTAPDGGLYVPDAFPGVEVSGTDSYPEVAAKVLAPYLAIPVGELERLAVAAYQGFSVPEVVPVRQLEDDLYLAELFWGPTLAFKDLALQMLGQLFEHEMQERGLITVVGATSGDTGSAAIEAFRGREGVQVVVLHPHGRVSEVQRLQMTTVSNDNVHNVAIEGTFDDCQRLVKQLFADATLDGIASANSINWVRIAAQTTYYAFISARMGREVDFVVPSGNFGNAYAGLVAREMGASIGRILVATNRNKALADVLEAGNLQVEPAVPTMSPAMDIQVPSNLERLLFHLSGDPAAVTDWMQSLESEGQLQLPASFVEDVQQLFAAVAISEEDTSAGMAEYFRATGTLIDPHTAVAMAAASRAKQGRPQVVLATAHPAKFPDAVQRATGAVPTLPERFADLLTLPERYTRLTADYPALRNLVQSAANA